MTTRAPASGATTTPPPATTGPRRSATKEPGRFRRWRWPAAVALALVLVTLLTVATQPRTSSIPLAPDNPHPDGARAAAQILGREGVSITFRETTASALAATPDDGTLFITDPTGLRPDQWEDVAASNADLVLTQVAYADLSLLTDAVVPTGEGGDGVRAAACDDPDAVAAGTLDTGSGDVRALSDDVVVCFPGAGDPSVGAYATFRQGDRRVTVVGNDRPFTNAALAEAGNAALVLRILGRTEHLTWYVPSPTDTAEPAGTLLPPGAGAVAAWALLVAVATMIWQGRRLGPVVVEPLPVVVKAAETTLGRARLYRRAAAHGHAAAALRAGAASRLAHRLGVPATAGPDALLDALARATGRDGAALAALLYGPSPGDDAALLALVHALDTLEAEVMRP